MYYTSSDLIRQFPHSDFSHCQKFIVSLERPGPALQPIYILLKVKAQPCSDVLTILTCFLFCVHQKKKIRVPCFADHEEGRYLPHVPQQTSKHGRLACSGRRTGAGGTGGSQWG